jgi:hypothetical protein
LVIITTTIIIIIIIIIIITTLTTNITVTTTITIAIIIIFLLDAMKELGWSLDAAYNHLLEVAPSLQINDGFKLQVNSFLLCYFLKFKIINQKLFSSLLYF